MELELQQIYEKMTWIQETLGMLMTSQNHLMELLKATTEANLNQSRLLLQLSIPQHSSTFPSEESGATLPQAETEPSYDDGPNLDFDPIDMEILTDLGVLSGSNQDTSIES